jgi:hypothetical protein
MTSEEGGLDEETTKGGRLCFTITHDEQGGRLDEETTNGGDDCVLQSRETSKGGGLMI